MNHRSTAKNDLILKRRKECYDARLDLADHFDQRREPRRVRPVLSICYRNGLLVCEEYQNQYESPKISFNVLNFVTHRRILLFKLSSRPGRHQCDFRLSKASQPDLRNRSRVLHNFSSADNEDRYLPFDIKLRARLARVKVFAPDEIAIVHVMNRAFGEKLEG